MTSAEISHWLRVDITLKHKVDLSTYTIFLTNRAEITDYVEDSFPILLSNSRLGTSSDREMTLPDSGSFRLLDSIGSLGVDRKFSDLLEKYEIIDQPIKVLYKSTTTTDYDPVFDNTSFTGNDIVFFGKVLDYARDIDQELPVINIRFDSRILSKRIVNKTITIDDFPDVSAESVGKLLPVVIGEDIQVRPVMVANDSTQTTFAYCTTLAGEHDSGGVQAYQARTDDGTYAEVLSASSVGTAVFSQTDVTTTYQITNTEVAFKLKKASETTRNYIITQIDVTFDGNGAGAVHDGSIECTIYDAIITYSIATGTGPTPGRAIARGLRNAADFDSSFDAAPNFTITFTLDRPLVLQSDKDYFIAMSHRPDAGAGTCSVRTTAPTTGELAWFRSGNSWQYTFTYDMAFAAYGVKFDDVESGSTTTDDQGLGAAVVNATQRTAVTGISNPDLGTLYLVFDVNGLKDDSGGSITGSASAQITTAHHAIKLLTQEWSGSAWSASSYWDFSEFSSTYSNGYTIAGATDGEYTLEDIIREICRNSAYRVVMLKSGKLAPYAWGSPLTAVTRFHNENSKVINVNSLESAFVVNNITIGYDKQLIYLDSTNIATQGISSDYTAAITVNSATNADYAAIIGNSESLYGKRYLNDRLYNFINTQAQAERLANYFLKNFNQPPVYVDLETPFDYFPDLEITNVIEIKNPSLPTYWGGSANTKMSYYDGEEVDPLSSGVMTRAKTYRAQIDGYRTSFNQDAVPTLLLTCRLLTNRYDPT